MDIRYKLESIAETEYRMNYEYDYSDFNPEGLQIQIGHDIKPDMEADMIAIKAKVSFVYGDSETLLATNTILATFTIQPIKEVLVIKEDGTFSSKNTMIIDTFLVVAMGVLRGVLMKNLKGTPLEGYNIPLIPLENFRAMKKHGKQ